MTSPTTVPVGQGAIPTSQQTRKNPDAKDDSDDEEFMHVEGGEREEELKQEPLNQEQKPDKVQYPEGGWFYAWNTTLNIQNIKACIHHTSQQINAYANNKERDEQLKKIANFSIK